MPGLFSAAEIAGITRGTLFSAESAHVESTAVSIDSRECREQCLFVALPGARTDGHAHLGQALANGARTLLVRRSWWEQRGVGRSEHDGEGRGESHGESHGETCGEHLCSNSAVRRCGGHGGECSHLGRERLNAGDGTGRALGHKSRQRCSAPRFDEDITCFGHVDRGVGEPDRAEYLVGPVFDGSNEVRFLPPGDS